MIILIAVCLVLLYVVNKHMVDEPVWLRGLANFGLVLAIIVAVLMMSGLIGR